MGVHVLEAAAKNLTSTALELGGETGNWCVIRRDADLRDAARKIAFFKILNSGQICININQVAVAEEVADRFIEELKAAFIGQIGSDPVHNPEYPRMITSAAFDKCVRAADVYRDRIILGGTGDAQTLRFAPTVIYPVDIREDIGQHELFSPLLPVVPYPDAEIETLLDTISRREHGLALYLFTKDIRWAKGVMQRMQYGGGCINEGMGLSGIYPPLRRPDRVKQIQSPAPGASLQRPLEIRADPADGAMSAVCLTSFKNTI